MAADKLQRPLSVRLVAKGVTSEDIVKAIFKQLPEECIMCVCPTIAECMYVCMYVCIHVCIYVCMNVCMNVCMHVCMCVAQLVRVCS